MGDFMGKRGFTLIELLGVIVLLGIVTTIAITSISGITNAIKKNMLEEKANFIEEAAALLGEDIKGSIIASNLKYKGNSCKIFYVSDLVPEYLNKDNDNDCMICSKREDTGNCLIWHENIMNKNKIIGCIVDPSDSDNYLDKYKVIIYYQNKRIKAKVDTENNLSCS